MSNTDTISLTNQGKVAYFYEKLTGRQPTVGEALDRLDEELEELYECIYALDKPHSTLAPHFLKEMTDVIYTLYGFAIANGWDLDGAFDATHKSNLSKQFTPIGKVIKGSGYVEPQMEKYLGLA